MVEIIIPDKPGTLIPVLKILDRYDVNISYMNSIQKNSDHQNFVMGLLIENSNVIEMLLEEIREIYTINIIGYDYAKNNFDNSIFYIKLANEVKKILNLSQEKTIEFISEANRVLQMLQINNENPTKVFEAIREFVNFMNGHRGSNFTVKTDKITLSGRVVLYAISPVCGSNTYILKADKNIILIDTGYALYKNEMQKIFHELFPDWDGFSKKIYITHADVDHCGLLSEIKDAVIYLNEKSADSLKRQHSGILDNRETKEFGFGYSKLSRIISDYTPPSLENAVIFDKNTPKEHEELLKIGEIEIADVSFDILEGSGGHLEGEMIFVSGKTGLIFTGDNLVNINDFSEDVKYFNSIAPYLMKSVNVDSRKATYMRKEILKLINEIQNNGKKPCIICGGHGPISILKDNVLEALKI
jgi:glyoxylase-like metal-dependent hydrolase (beta-lactamase superfamily II)/acetolactate synthase regulatory subunit